MDFVEYQSKARQTAVYPSEGAERIYYAVLGLGGETGEVQEKIKKIIRDHGGVVTPERRADLQKEIGDVLWYLAALCTELGIDLNDAAEGNIEKLRDRWERNRIHGSGDNR